MGITKNLGGDRIGSGNKMNVHLKGYERSTHDLGSIWRSTMSAGTLVPFMVQYALPGDTFDIDLGADVKTYPTLGPLFGSFKMQLDVFQCPVRLYQGDLHNNKLGIGMDMSNIKLPQIKAEIWADNRQLTEDNQKVWDGKHVNPSSLMAYLGIRGFGKTIATGSPTPENGYVDVEMNAIPLVAYWDIFKNYYANKQEEDAYVIHGSNVEITDIAYKLDGGGGGSFLPNVEKTLPVTEIDSMYIVGNNINEDNVSIQIENIGTPKWRTLKEWTNENLFTVTQENDNEIIIMGKGGLAQSEVSMIGINENAVFVSDEISLKRFKLENLDKMREEILKKAGQGTVRISKETIEPYGLALQRTSVNDSNNWYDGLITIKAMNTQEGLAVKTYQSDIFNNWLQTEWIDGDNGINAITAIDTSSGSFSIDTLNLSQKVYDLLNRIAVSGGSYEDWLESVWAHQGYRRAESPIYHGGLSKEVVFSEVVGTAETEADGILNPLGSLAGKGGLSQKHKGGKVTIKVDEPSVIIGIVSLTPRIDYSQGNEWHVNLKTMDDFHKPALDGIGFQELITEQMSANDVIREDDDVTYFSAGKQPAWINYMTNYNRAYGHFAEEDKSMFMTLNRRYEYDHNGRIKDLTTYIDPAKFNYLFAQNDRGAQNFWVQIAMDITARRKMSAKIIPNL